MRRELDQSCSFLAVKIKDVSYQTKKEKLMMDTDTFMTVLRQVAIPNFFFAEFSGTPVSIMQFK